MLDKNYQISRETDFKIIYSLLKENVNYNSDNTLICKGDSLELLKLIPDNTISLILIDPPYHTTKKKNITNDTAFSTDEDFLNWINAFSVEWSRILKPNGALYLFCSTKMSARLEINLSKNFNVLSHIVWSKPNEPGFDGWKGKMKKESLRQWYAHSERIIFAEPAVEGNLFRSYFAKYIKEQRLRAGFSGHRLTEIIGAYGKVNHGGAVSNWEAGRNVPSKIQYLKIAEAIIKTGKVKNMLPYEDLIRPFNVCKNVEFTDVWAFYSVKPYKGKHPAEKPIDMLEHCINSSTYEGDIVLDCFAGSGSTAVASLLNKRKTISIEIDEKWANSIKDRIENFETKYLHSELSADKRVKELNDYKPAEYKNVFSF